MLAEARWTVESSVDPGRAITKLWNKRSESYRSRFTASFNASQLEELSEPELSILRLMSGDLSQREMGDHLYISFNTVKTHTKHIYRKLAIRSDLRPWPGLASSICSRSPRVNSSLGDDNSPCRASWCFS